MVNRFMIECERFMTLMDTLLWWEGEGEGKMERLFIPKMPPPFDCDVRAYPVQSGEIRHIKEAASSGRLSWTQSWLIYLSDNWDNAQRSSKANENHEDLRKISDPTQIINEHCFFDIAGSMFILKCDFILGYMFLLLFASFVVFKGKLARDLINTSGYLIICNNL